MKSDREVSSLLVSILLISLLTSFIPQMTINTEITLRGIEQERMNIPLANLETRSVVAGTPHGPITIAGNDEFKAMAGVETWDGDGSKESPFIIEGYDIDLGGTNGNCIDIMDTTAHFVIRYCSLTGATASGRAGVYLSNVTNCEVYDNVLYANKYGMIIYANNATILDNDIDAGTSTGAGLVASTMENSRISGNTVTGGDVGINLGVLDHCEVSNNMIIDSIEVCMYVNGAENTTFLENKIVNGSLYGLYIGNTYNCTIIGNNCSLSGDGIHLYHSNENSIKECTIEENEYDFYFESSSMNTIEFCVIKDSYTLSILVDSTSAANRFNWNIFPDTSGGVYCDGIANVFDYNYYAGYTGPDTDHNGIGDYPFPLGGSAGNADSHPLLLEPIYPVWNPAPTNQYLEFGDEFSYSLEVSSPIPMEDWTISDKINFAIDETGTIRDIDILDVGTYSIDATVTNVYDLSLDGSFMVTVTDTVSPVWVSLVQDETFDLGEDIEFQLMAWDLAGIASWTISDSENFTLTRGSYADISIATIQNLDSLPSGIYPLTVTVYDNNGNSETADLDVIVGEAAIDSTNPIWIVLPYDISVEEGESFYLQIGAWDESGIASWDLTGSSLFTINENGIITNTGLLTAGTYDLEARAYDPEGNYCSATFTISVVTATTTPTAPGGSGDVNFIVSISGLVLASIALIVSIVTFLNSRKES